MRCNLPGALLLISGLIIMNSCSSDASELSISAPVYQKILNYTYSASEVETMNLINDYRVNVGLNTLEKINHISYKSEEHDNYMIANNVVNHNGFISRSENIIKVLGAKTVGENIACNYNTPKAALDAWLGSVGHKENIEGDYTHFGISIRKDPVNGKNYYTNIFVKI